MAKTLMIQGTASNVGKSLLTTGLCRLYSRRGLKVAPFKAQNMALNSFITPQGREVGRAQAVQAAAAGTPLRAEMNPVLLKPLGDSLSRVILLGKPWKTLRAAEYYRERPFLWSAVTGALESLAPDFDLIIVEGAGSPAEINLKADEIVNMRVARHLNAPVLLAGDIDRGGVFAFLYGTMELLEPEERALIRGFIINNFRGDPSLLRPGLEMLKNLTGGRPTVGVVPHLRDLRLAREDSLFLDEGGMGTPKPGLVDIAVLRLPGMTNYDDFDPLAAEPGVNLRFIDSPAELGPGSTLPRALILPGTETPLRALGWLRERNLAAAVAACRDLGVSVAGIGEGFRMMGSFVRGVSGEGAPESPAGQAEPPGQVDLPGQVHLPGLGLLPMEGRFDPEEGKRLLRGLTREGDEVRGYGVPGGWVPAPGDEAPSDGSAPGPMPEAGSGKAPPGAPPAPEAFLVLEGGRAGGLRSADGRVWGAALHGVFDAPGFRRRWLRSLGWTESGSPRDREELQRREFDRLADHLEAHLDMGLLDRIIGI